RRARPRHPRSRTGRPHRRLSARIGSSRRVSMAKEAKGILATDMSPSGTSGASGTLLDVDHLAVELGERFRAAGFQLYLVGGAVRDLLMQRPASGELDFTTDARPEETLRVLQGWADRRYLHGIRFGTVGAWRKD